MAFALTLLVLAAFLAVAAAWKSAATRHVQRGVSGLRLSLEAGPKSPRENLVDSVSRVASTASRAALGVAAAGAVAGVTGGATLPAFARGPKAWEKVELGTKETLFDIAFDPNKPEHGWLVGAKGTFLETFDEGKTWSTRTFNSLDEDEDISYRFEVASLSDNEGWIIGKPAIMLHTRDGGKQFERIPVSPKLPGEPVSIKSTGAGKAEMITSQGAVYETVNGGLNWKAQVKETIDATLNRVSSSGTSGASYFSGKIANQIRDVNGNYIAISARGNLFLTWVPGQDYWVPHNRGSSRRCVPCCSLLSLCSFLPPLAPSLTLCHPTPTPLSNRPPPTGSRTWASSATMPRTGCG